MGSVGVSRGLRGLLGRPVKVALHNLYDSKEFPKGGPSLKLTKRLALLGSGANLSRVVLGIFLFKANVTSSFSDKNDATE